jgi:hypothetical protein
VGVVRFDPAGTPIRCAAYLGAQQGFFPEDLTSSEGPFAWPVNMRPIEEALNFSRKCDLLYELPPTSGGAAFGMGGPNGYFKFFRWVRSNYSMPEGTIIMDVGAGTGRLMCMLPILFGSPMIVLGVENTDHIFSHGVGTINQARTLSSTKVNCFVMSSWFWFIYVYIHIFCVLLFLSVIVYCLSTSSVIVFPGPYQLQRGDIVRWGSLRCDVLWEQLSQSPWLRRPAEKTGARLLGVRRHQGNTEQGSQGPTTDPRNPLAHFCESETGKRERKSAHVAQEARVPRRLTEATYTSLLHQDSDRKGTSCDVSKDCQPYHPRGSISSPNRAFRSISG